MYGDKGNLVPQGGDLLRNNNLDAIRLGMALTVVWSHSYAIWLGSEASEPISLLMGGIYNAGNIAVLAFFAISGFLITASWERSNSWIGYLKRRMLRIHPGYLVAVTICSIVVVPAFSSRDFGDLSLIEIWEMVTNLWLRNRIIKGDAFGGGPVNGSLWSIPYEFWCYLGLMLLGFAGMLRRRISFVAIAVLVILLRALLDMRGIKPGGYWIDDIIGFPYFWFNVLPPFMLGGVVYLFRDRIPRNSAILVLLIIATATAANSSVSDPVRTVITRTIFPFALVYATFYTAFSWRLQLHHVAKIGDFSYGTYLYAFPIQQMLNAQFKNAISFPVYIALSLGLSLAAGVASWFLVEQWFLRSKKPTRGKKEDLSSGSEPVVATS